MTPPLKIAPDVTAALTAGQPVVALESTIITHGMPHPENIDTAHAVEEVIRSGGATPATITVIDGEIRVGLDQKTLEDFAAPDRRDIEKLSRANLAHCLALGGSGSTTVAATMIAAHLAGIRVFATGGLGGVHRGAEASFDISADLQELSRTPVAVVCSGAKAILDIPKTLEVLETLGVPVITYGQAEFPAFWSRGSGQASPISVGSENGVVDIANQIRMQDRLGLNQGCVIANPIPEPSEIPSNVIEPIIEQAVSKAMRSGVSHGAVTPLILSEIFEMTEGRSLAANKDLVLNNASLATKIAIELCNRRRDAI